MGPRSRDRGNKEIFADSFASSQASMGPRSRDRGNDHLTLINMGVAGLQWGRDRVIAETLVYGWIQTFKNKLQWGRDRVIAET